MSGNFCAKTVVIEIRPIAVKYKKTESRENMFIERREVRKLPSNKRDATPISFNNRHSDDYIMETPLIADLV